MFRRCGRPLGVSSRLQPLCGLRLRTALCSVCSPLQPFGPPLFAGLACDAPLCPQFAIVALPRYRLQVSFAHWTSASPVSRTARGEAPSQRARASCAPRHCRPQFAMVVPRRAQSALAALPCLLGLLRPVSATGGGLRAPLPVSAKILRIFGRGNCKEAIFALKNGIFRRKNRPVPAVHAAGDDCTAKGLRSSIHNGRLAAPNGLQRSLVHWTFASPVSATGGGEAPSLSRSPRDF